MALELPIQEPCYFCEIISKQTDQWNLIASTDLTATLLNGRQYEVGQCIVVPRRHAPTLFDIDEQEAAAIMEASRELAGILMKAFDPTGILIYQNNGVGSGQEVPHFHMHVVPRQPDSDWGLGPPHIARLQNESRKDQFDHTIVNKSKRATARKIRNAY